MTLFEFHELAEAEGGSVLDPLDRRQTEALCQRVRMVFQDALASLDSRMPVGDVVARQNRNSSSSTSRSLRLARTVRTAPRTGSRL